MHADKYRCAHTHTYTQKLSKGGHDKSGMTHRCMPYSQLLIYSFSDRRDR